jgi:hypothetical protein
MTTTCSGGQRGVLLPHRNLGPAVLQNDAPESPTNDARRVGRPRGHPRFQQLRALALRRDLAVDSQAARFPTRRGPVEADGPVDAQTDARPQGPWTPANGRRRPRASTGRVAHVHPNSRTNGNRLHSFRCRRPDGLNLRTDLRSPSWGVSALRFPSADQTLTTYYSSGRRCLRCKDSGPENGLTNGVHYPPPFNQRRGRVGQSAVACKQGASGPQRSGGTTKGLARPRSGKDEAINNLPRYHSTYL